MTASRDQAMAEYRYTVYFERVEGGFNIVVPAIPEICTFGATMEEAREMARDAIRCVLESAEQSGEAIPRDPEHKETLTVAV